MAKDSKQRNANAKQTANTSDTVDAAVLQAEVQSFASGLGLAAAGTGSGLDASNFRPSAAKQRPAKAPGRSIAPSTRKPAPRKQNAGDNRSRPEQANQAARLQPPDPADTVRERTWNAGVGPRPGNSNSLAVLQGSIFEYCQ